MSNKYPECQPSNGTRVHRFPEPVGTTPNGSLPTPDKLMTNRHSAQTPLQNGKVDKSTGTDVAICGIGLRLPGGIRNCDDYWNLLYNGLDARSPVPSNRYNVDGFDDSLGGKDTVKFKHGYFLDEDLSALDTSFFTLSKGELETVIGMVWYGLVWGVKPNHTRCLHNNRYGITGKTSNTIKDAKTFKNDVEKL
ncbi:hypothetical protein IWW34DRAFT_855478 [Fusarium oxysporum f. sp. albedinis]|nr:hypothetical protein IWW34DRAFT_855478 [Fusarium oxysporum f. sp. albedinis]KAK2468699.1 hypothetical protein H9L39_19626 [Fusarium oxysporum f. sp. albedinis]